MITSEDDAMLMAFHERRHGCRRRKTPRLRGERGHDVVVTIATRYDIYATTVMVKMIRCRAQALHNIMMRRLAARRRQDDDGVRWFYSKCLRALLG